MFKNSLFLSALVLSNTAFGYDLPSVKSVSDFVSNNINTPQAKVVLAVVGAGIAVVSGVKYVQKRNEQRAIEAAKMLVLEMDKNVEKAGSVTTAEISHFQEKSSRLDALETEISLKNSLEERESSKNKYIELMLTLHDTCKNLISSAECHAKQLLDAQILLVSRGITVSVDRCVSRLNVLANTWQEKLNELSNKPFFQEALLRREVANLKAHVACQAARISQLESRNAELQSRWSQSLPSVRTLPTSHYCLPGHQCNPFYHCDLCFQK